MTVKRRKAKSLEEKERLKKQGGVNMPGQEGFEFDAELTLTPEQLDDLEEQIFEEMRMRFGRSYFPMHYTFRIPVKVFIQVESEEGGQDDSIL